MVEEDDSALALELPAAPVDTVGRVPLAHSQVRGVGHMNGGEGSWTDAGLNCLPRQSGKDQYCEGWRPREHGTIYTGLAALSVRWRSLQAIEIIFVSASWLGSGVRIWIGVWASNAN